MEKLETKYGIAYLENGYYRIYSSNKYYKQFLHRLIYQDANKCTLLKDSVIHHIDENPLNNDPSNLKLVSRGEHSILHNTGKIASEETRKKMSNSHKGRNVWNKGVNHSINTCVKMSKSHNTTGFFRVHKQKDSSCKQGFIYHYSYFDVDGKRKVICSVDIDKLKDKVLSKGLEWFKLGDSDE